jgi:hypothetical protein
MKKSCRCNGRGVKLERGIALIRVRRPKYATSGSCAYPERGSGPAQALHPGGEGLIFLNLGARCRSSLEAGNFLD